MAVVILKATTRCNATCAYCAAIDQVRTDLQTMPLDLLELFFVRAHEFLLENPRERLLIIWHGGEPLLLGPTFFEQALELQQRICGQTAGRIGHRMQSNLTLFSRSYAGVFRKMGIFGIGTSYEPIPGLRGLGPQRDSAAYQRSFHRGLRILEQEGFGWGLIYVVTRPALDRGLEIFRALTELKADGNIKFQPVLLCGRDPGELSITPEQFTEFLGAIFPEWWRQRQTYPLVEPFRVITENIIKGTGNSYCLDSGKCALTHLSIAPDGAVFHCGRSLDHELLEYGHLSRQTFVEILANPQRKTLLHRNQILREGDCRDCRFWSICHGGCPLDALAETGSFLHKSPWCTAKKGFIEKYFEPVTGVRFQPQSEPGTKNP